MVFRRFQSGKRPIRSVKHIVDTSSIVAAVTNTILIRPVAGVDAYSLADENGVPTGATVNSIFLIIYIYSEGGEVSNEVPLTDWYIIKNPGNTFGTTFGAQNLPTPGATGSHINKRFIFHEEKGLAGGGDASLTGIPMVFKGVILIPRGMRRIAEQDEILIAIRTNFASKVCAKAIYKHYT